MSRLFNESFEAGHLLRFAGSTGATAIVTSPVLDGLRCLQLGVGSQFADLSTPVAEFYVGFFFRTAINALTIFRWENTSSGLVLGTIKWNPTTQTLEAYTGDTVTLVASGTRVLVVDTNYHIQVHVSIANAGGTIELKLDDNSELTFTGDTQPGADTTVNRYRWASSSTSQVDALVVNSTTGSVDNSWPGILRFQRMLPAGPGTYVNNWSRNTGSTNWEQVDEVPPDGDTTYLYTTTANIYESFSMADQALSGVIYKALLSAAVAKKDSGTVQLALGIVDDQNATNYYVANSALGTSYGVVEGRQTVDPSTGSAWTSGGINATQGLIVSTTT